MRFAGQILAWIVAESRAAAEEAAELVEVELEPLPATTDVAAALEEGAPQLHERAPGNLAYRWDMGDPAATEAAFAKAAHVTRMTVRSQRLIVASLEPRAILARYQGDRWEVWAGSQGAFGMRARIAKALQVAPERLRVHAPDIGGGFGMKLMAHPEYGLTCLAAQELGRPVKWIGDRSDAMLADAQARDLETDAEAAFDADGRLLAMRWRSRSNLGAYYSSYGAGIHTVFSAPIMGGMYRLPVGCAETLGVFTNTAPTDAYRGAGRPEAIYVTERLMERAAREMGRDPVAFRKLNLLTPEALPWRNVGGLTYDSLNPPEVVDRCADAADRAGFPARRAESEAAGRLRGWALCHYMERTGGAPTEHATLALRADGALVIRVGTQSTGQGHETAWAQVAHERLGVAWDDIRLEAGDSDAIPFGGNTGGSRSGIAASRTLMRAAEAVIEQARKLAAERLEAAEADIDFSAAEGGLFRVVGTDRTVRLVELAAEAGGLEGAGEVDDLATTFPNGAHAAEVEIDRETGRLSVLRYTAVDDFGRLLNPALVAGQVHGGAAQGAGQAMMEQARWSADGQPMTASLMDYALPRAADLPGFDVSFYEGAPAPSNPLGLKGCGEAGAVGGIPSVTLAALDALRSAGAGEVETPLTAEKLWRALNP